MRAYHGSAPSNNSTHSSRCRCGGSAELHYCAANNSVGYQCTACGRPLGNWLPKCLLADIALETLPPWHTRAERRRGPQQLTLLEVQA